MKFHSIVFVIFLTLLTGCAQTMRQHDNMIDAMNGKAEPLRYNKTYIIEKFGYPHSNTTSSADNVTTEVWTYKTNMPKSGVLLNLRPGKTRYMKITMVNNIVVDSIFE